MTKRIETNPWRGALSTLGGTFMTSTEIGERSKRTNMPRSALYFRGRAGILGDLTPAAAHQILGIFPTRIIDRIWQNSASVSPAESVEAYLGACHEWGRNHLEPSDDLDRLAGMLVKILDGAEPTALPLATAWQGAPRPADVPALVAQCAMVAREIRGGLHFAALALVNLPIDRAILVDNSGGTKRLQSTGWNDEEIATLKTRGQKGDRERWREAEAATEAAFLGLLGEIVGERGIAEFAELLTDVDATP